MLKWFHWIVYKMIHFRRGNCPRSHGPPPFKDQRVISSPCVVLREQTATMSHLAADAFEHVNDEQASWRWTNVIFGTKGKNSFQVERTPQKECVSVFVSSPSASGCCFLTRSIRLSWADFLSHFSTLIGTDNDQSGRLRCHRRLFLGRLPLLACGNQSHWFLGVNLHESCQDSLFSFQALLLLQSEAGLAEIKFLCGHSECFELERFLHY